MNLYYPFTIEKGDKHGYIAQFIDIEEAYTFAETIDE
jgi:predicted RNase H-like HicB family nuclease